MSGEKVARSAAYYETVTLPLFRHAKNALHFSRRVDQAHAVMLAETGILSREDVATILAGIRSVDAALDIKSLDTPEPFEDLFFFLEDRLIKQIGSAIGGNLHLARSRNDLEATVFRLALKENLRLAIAAYLDQTDSLLSKAEAERDTIVVAFTHGQPAQPTTFGHYLAAKIEADIRHARRMFAAYDDMDACPLGAVAITTTGFPIDRHRVASLLGFRQVQENSYGCIAAADYLLATYSALRNALIDIGRLSQDLALWSNGALSQIRVSDEFCQISSVMPQKRNPLAIEYIRTLASLTAANCDAVMTAIHNAPFADMVDAETPTQTVGASAMEEFQRVCNLTQGLVTGLEVDARGVDALIASSTAGATELADSFVRRENLSFRQAHVLTQALAASALTAGQDLLDIDAETAAHEFEAITGHAMKGDWLEHLNALSPEESVRVREVFGGPGPEALGASLKRYRTDLADLRSKLKQTNDTEIESQARLQEAVRSFPSPEPENKT